MTSQNALYRCSNKYTGQKFVAKKTICNTDTVLWYHADVPEYAVFTGTRATDHISERSSDYGSWNIVSVVQSVGETQ